jgi:choline monooxygenase
VRVTRCQHAPVREGSEHYKGKVGDGEAYYYWLFPNIMLNIYEGQLQSNVVIPLDAANTLVRFEWFAYEPLPDPQTERALDRAGAVQRRGAGGGRADL